MNIYWSWSRSVAIFFNTIALKSEVKVYTTQEGIEVIKNNPQVYTTQEGIEEIKNSPQVYATQEGMREI